MYETDETETLHEPALLDATIHEIHNKLRIPSMQNLSCCGVQGVPHPGAHHRPCTRVEVYCPCAMLVHPHILMVHS
jgi:hypothetical protein